MKKNWLNYIAIFLLILGTYFFIKSFAHADISFENENSYQYYRRTTKYNTRPSLGVERGKWQEEYEMHMFEAIRTCNDAKEKCWWLPSMSDRDRARMCWTTAISVLACSTPQAKLVTFVSQLLIQYGLSAIDEWDYIQDKLYWSEFHFRECEKYAILLHG